MNALFIIPLISFLSTPTYTSEIYNNPIKIAVIDTGLNLSDPRFSDHLCLFGHRNFVQSETMEDRVGHGTFVAGLIEKYAKNANYCLMVYKYYKESEEGNDIRENLALEEAIKNKADIVNFSGGGDSFDKKEASLILSHPEITFVVSAGNEGRNLDDPQNTYYPASLFYPNIVVVASTDQKGNLAKTSNYSKRIKNTEIGVNAISYLPDNKTGTMSGTSMATAIFSGKLVDTLSKIWNSRGNDGHK